MLPYNWLSYALLYCLPYDDLLNVPTERLHQAGAAYLVDVWVGIFINGDSSRRMWTIDHNRSVLNPSFPDILLNFMGNVYHVIVFVCLYVDFFISLAPFDHVYKTIPFYVKSITAGWQKQIFLHKVYQAKTSSIARRFLGKVNLFTSMVRI